MARQAEQKTQLTMPCGRGTVKYSVYSENTDAGPVSIGPAFVCAINYV